MKVSIKYCEICKVFTPIHHLHDGHYLCRSCLGMLGLDSKSRLFRISLKSDIDDIGSFLNTLPKLSIENNYYDGEMIEKNCDIYKTLLTRIGSFNNSNIRNGFYVFLVRNLSRVTKDYNKFGMQIFRELDEMKNLRFRELKKKLFVHVCILAIFINKQSWIPVKYNMSITRNCNKLFNELYEKMCYETCFKFKRLKGGKIKRSLMFSHRCCGPDVYVKTR